MKKILYFVLAIITIVYIGVLCYANIAVNEPAWMYYVEVYGGLAIALAFSVVNLFGSPLKIAFFIILIIAVVVLILTLCIPDIIRNFLGIIS